MKAILAFVTLALCGCATCRDHPVACGVAAGIVVGAIVIAADHNHGYHHFGNNCIGYYEQHGDTLSEARRDCR